MVEFTHRTQEDLYARVAGYLQQSFGELARPNGNAPSFSLTIGYVSMSIAVSPEGKDAIVDIVSLLGKGINVNEEVGRFLLRKNLDWRFGNLGVDDDGDILLAYSLFGEAVSKRSFSKAVRRFAGAADKIETELTMRFK